MSAYEKKVLLSYKDGDGNKTLLYPVTKMECVDDIDDYKQAILALIYPVGAIYISTVATSPAVIFGFGTWEQIKDRFLLSAGSTYTAGATGGEASHTLTTAEMPAHSHGHPDVAAWPLVDNPDREWGVHYYNSSNQTHPYTQWLNATYSAGGGQAHNNMPPYLVVYVWKRTA